MTAPSPRLALTSSYAVLPVGEGVDAFAALRAKLSGLTEHPFLELCAPDPDWDPPEPLRAGKVDSIDVELEGAPRLLALALAALRGLITAAKLRRAEVGSTALFLALPEPDEAVATWQLERTFLTELLARAGVDGFALAAVDATGHTAAFGSVARASAALGRDVARVIIVAADTYLDSARLRAWDEDRNRLRSRRNPDGFLPGEGAIALLLEPAHHAERPSTLLLSTPCFAREPQAIAGDRQSTGSGLTEALRAALLGNEAPGVVLSDINGEAYGAFEWGLARARVSPALDTARLFHPAESVGDVGAATGALLIGLAAHRLARARDAAAHMLLVAGSTNGDRAALCVSAPARSA